MLRILKVLLGRLLLVVKSWRFLQLEQVDLLQIGHWVSSMGRLTANSLSVVWIGQRKKGYIFSPQPKNLQVELMVMDVPRSQQLMLLREQVVLALRMLKVLPELLLLVGIQARAVKVLITNGFNELLLRKLLHNQVVLVWLILAVMLEILVPRPPLRMVDKSLLQMPQLLALWLLHNQGELVCLILTEI